MSKQAHCLDDLLSRYRAGELGDVEIPVVISNHPDHADAVSFMGLEYAQVPVTPETKPEQERVILDLEHRVFAVGRKTVVFD